MTSLLIVVDCSTLVLIAVVDGPVERSAEVCELMDLLTSEESVVDISVLVLVISLIEVGSDVKVVESMIVEVATGQILILKSFISITLHIPIK